MTEPLFIDLEVFSPVDVKRGVDAHVHGKGAEIILATWAWGDGEVVDVEPTTEGGRRDLKRTLRRASQGIAHNAWYERNALGVLVQIPTPVEFWHCTMAQAYAHGLPGSLDALCKALGVPQDLAKKEGKELIRLFCRPQPRTGKRVYPQDAAAKWERFVGYGRGDITALREVFHRMPKVNYKGREKLLWTVDQRINERGIPIDRTLAKKAVRACQQEKAELDGKVEDITLGTVTSGTQLQRLKGALASFGVELNDMQAVTLEAASSDKELCAEARTLIEARQAVGLSSTAKYQRVLEAVGPDGRLRGTLQFSGAGRTRRWAGRIFQPHNLPRPSRPADEVEAVVEAVLQGDYDLIDENVHRMCSDTIRSLLCAGEGKKLVVADYSAIEGRVLAWLAGEQWKLEAYEAGKDLYVATYCAIFGLPDDADIGKAKRQQGKVFELAFGYEGGVGALLTWASTYGIDPKDLARSAWAEASRSVRDHAKMLTGYAFKREGTAGWHGLGEEVYCGLETAKLMWRAAAPKTVRVWKLYQEAAELALSNPGEAFAAGRCQFLAKGKTLCVRLPSGGILFYYRCKLTRDGITYAGTYGGRVPIYGGKFTENITQAAARDLLGHALIEADKAGFSIILHVHDEIISEEDEDGHSLGELVDVMCQTPSWAKGLPLAGEGYESKRYRKE